MSDFLDYLNSSVDLARFNIGTNTETNQEIFINVGKGYITDGNDNILLSLGIANKNFYDLDYQRSEYGSRTITYVPALKELKVAKDLCLLLSNELITNKKYALFYKKLCVNYINDAYSNDIEVRFLTSEKIEKLNYSNEFSLRFNTIEQLQSHLQNLVPVINFLNDSDYSSGNINPGLNYSLTERNTIYTPPVVEINPISELPPDIEYVNPFPVEEARERLRELNGFEGESITQWDAELPNDYMISADIATNVVDTDIFISTDSSIVINPVSSINLIDDTPF